MLSDSGQEAKIATGINQRWASKSSQASTACLLYRRPSRLQRTWNCDGQHTAPQQSEGKVRSAQVHKQPRITRCAAKRWQVSWRKLHWRSISGVFPQPVHVRSIDSDEHKTPSGSLSNLRIHIADPDFDGPHCWRGNENRARKSCRNASQRSMACSRIPCTHNRREQFNK